MLFIEKFADELIKKAQREGQFDNLEGAGKPLVFEDDSMVPEDCRMAYKILRNSGHVPPEVQDRKEINNLVDMLSQCRDEQTRYRQIQKVNLLITRMNMRRTTPVNLEQDQVYYERIVETVRVGEKQDGKDG